MYTSMVAFGVLHRDEKKTSHKQPNNLFPINFMDHIARFLQPGDVVLLTDRVIVTNRLP